MRHGIARTLAYCGRRPLAGRLQQPTNSRILRVEHSRARSLRRAAAGGDGMPPADAASAPAAAEPEPARQRSATTICPSARSNTAPIISGWPRNISATRSKCIRATPRPGWGLAASYDRLRRFDLADRAYAQAIGIVGPTVEILNNQGYSYMLRGDYKRARETLGAAQRKDPGNKYVANNLHLLETSYAQGQGNSVARFSLAAFSRSRISRSGSARTRTCVVLDPADRNGFARASSASRMSGMPGAESNPNELLAIDRAT